MTDMKQIVIGVAVILAGIVAFSSMFVVNERDQALVLQLGRVKRLVENPGLHFKFPWPFQNIVYFEDRVLDFDARAEEIPTRDQKQIIVDAFARYRIVDPLLFFQTATNEQGMTSRLDNIVTANLRAVFGEVDLATVLTPKRADLMSTIAKRVNEEGKNFGIDVLDVRLRRVDLPEENSQAIFRRMETQRQQEARRIRAEGDREARRIRAEADKEARIIVAEAERRANILRGEGDATAQEIYNKAYGQDPEFFDFWVSMRALSDGLTGNTTSYVGPPEGDFFRFFGNIDGRDGVAKPPRGADSARPR